MKTDNSLLTVAARPATGPLSLDDLTLILFGASAFQYLNAACELNLFELLRSKPNSTKEEIARRLELQPRAIDILLLGTTSLRLTERVNGTYRNAAAVEQLFEEGTWASFKAVVGFEQHICYEGQVDFTESLRTNKNVGLRRVRGTGRDLYHRLSENPHLERYFYDYMRSWSELSNPLLFKSVDFTQVRKVLDVGGGDGVNAIALAKAYPNLEVTVLEIPGTAPITRRRIEEMGLSARVKVHAGDMFAEAFPTGHDCVLFSHQLVIWTPEENTALLRKAHEALTPGGRVVIFSSISKDEGDGPLMAALDSVYFAAIPAEGGMIYSYEQYEGWMKDAGFKSAQRIPCGAWTPHGVLIGAK
ncbi:methyltransferase domain-containing protein [Myxococcus sp. AM009]|uniref:methyltransferase n=1 Tax=unclassified Myxococcus TaxID=2648731 RepID=UPI001595D396|nr:MULTISPECIES: methyltransferase [unclassified Myxococcus]NVI98244.1 methyltransferase domain-containing protein [Myxococcus sp. AM009]NVJ14861.1 methyltransferase domain-containing protein [Myxococcus sp. AM010]